MDEVIQLFDDRGLEVDLAGPVLWSQPLDVDPLLQVPPGVRDSGAVVECP